MIVLFDACVLFPFHLRNLLVHLAQTDMFRAKWTEQILDECFKSIQRQYPGLNPKNLQKTRTLMGEAIADALVDGYQELIPGLHLPDPGDRHVLAAGICCRAQTIVTSNLKDFPAEVCAPYGLQIQSPDVFVLQLIEKEPHLVWHILMGMTRDLKHPPLSLPDLFAHFERTGLTGTALALRKIERNLS